MNCSVSPRPLRAGRHLTPNTRTAHPRDEDRERSMIRTNSRRLCGCGFYFKMFFFKIGVDHHIDAAHLVDHLPEETGVGLVPDMRHDLRLGELRAGRIDVDAMNDRMRAEICLPRFRQRPTGTSASCEAGELG